MRLATVAPLALFALLGTAAPAALAAQDEGKGKIDDVEHSAQNTPRSGHHDDDDDGGGGFLVGMLRFIFHAQHHAQRTAGDSAAAPEPPGQGYLKYPWARPLGPERFVLRDVTTGRDFGNVSAAYFIDDQSSLRAAQFTLEGAYDAAHIAFEYAFYREPTASGIDYLHLARVGVSGLPRIGDLGYVKLGVGLQGLYLDDGDAAGGPELEAGVQLFPARPFGLDANARAAAMTWKDGPLFSFGFVDLRAGGSLFVGRVELRAGYQWTRVGVGSPFRGPQLGMRVWF
jgi:hypothetical protein